MAGPFPNELLVEIFANLTKADCKTGRLVSTTWSVLAASFVFDTVHVGSRDEGLKVFTTIAEHPFLSKKVIDLSFDTRLFEQGIGRNSISSCCYSKQDLSFSCIRSNDCSAMWMKMIADL